MLNKSERERLQHLVEPDAEGFYDQEAVYGLATGILNLLDAADALDAAQARIAELARLLRETDQYDSHNHDGYEGDPLRTDICLACRIDAALSAGRKEAAP